MKKIIITPENSGVRIDKFLVKEFFNYTRGEIIRNIKEGNALVNRKKVKPSYVLKEKDEIQLPSPQPSPKGRGGLVPNPDLKIKIIHQDENIIVINKPAGISTHPSTSSGQVLEKNTLSNFLLAKFPEIKNVGDPSINSGQANLRPGIVHRLDKDTSGVMAVARSQKAFDELKKLFQIRNVKKEYLAVVFGKLKNKKGVIEKPIARAKSYKKQTIANAKTKTKIRPAVTKYEVLKEYKNYSLVKAIPKTGRTHQIRIHLASLGNPIVGDEKYKFKNLKTPEGIRRQLLHAEKLEFELFGKKYFFEAPLPEDLTKFLVSLIPH